jgi:tetratricopeptide (TPR) repeat protein
MTGSYKAVQSRFDGGWRRMNRLGSLWMVMLIFAMGLVAGCHTDPNVKKQKYLESGKRYSGEGKYKEASIQFQNAIKIDKSFADAHYELAQAYVHLSQFSQAYGELMRTIDLQPTNYKARLDAGNLLLAAGKTDLAQAQANVVLAAQPNNPDVHAMLAAIAVKTGHKDQAMVEIHRALELEPNRAVFHEDLAFLQAADPTQTSSVEEELKKAIVLDPKSVNAKLLLSAFYIRNGQWQQAEQASRDAIATDPKSIPARASLAQLFLRQGNQAKAEEVLRQASQDLANDQQGARLLADYYTGSGQTDKAKAEFAALVAKTPKSFSLRKAYIRILLQDKDYATARTVVAGLIKDDPKDPEAAGLNGIVLLNDGKANDAVAALMDATKNYPKDAFLQYWLGRAALAKGDNDLGEKSLKEAAYLNPSKLDAEEELARIAGQRGDLDLLNDVATKTIAAVPRFPGGYVWRAAVEMNRNAQDKAEADLKTAISIAPQAPQAYLELGKMRFAQKRFPEGSTLLQQALQNDPNSVEAVRLLVSYDLFQKKPADGLARLKAQIEKSPKNSGLYDLLAQLQMQTNNIDQAADSAQKAVQLNPGDSEAVMLFAQIQVKRGQTANAVAAWEQWLVAHPNDAGVIAVLGTLEESRGDHVKAEADYRRALQIQPKNAIASNNLAYLMLENGENVDVALSLAQTARQALPESSNTADTLALAYYHKGTYGFARDLLEAAIKNSPNDAAMHYHLGMVYSKLSDRNNALVHLKKAVALAPDSQEGKEAKVALQGLS